MCTHLFLVPYSFFVALGEVCLSTSIAVLQQRVPGPNLSQFHLYDNLQKTWRVDSWLPTVIGGGGVALKGSAREFER